METITESGTVQIDLYHSVHELWSVTESGELGDLLHRNEWEQEWPEVINVT
jgi:hypothetical protein